MLSDRLLSRLSYSQLEWLRRNASSASLLADIRGDTHKADKLLRRCIRLERLQQNHPERFED